MTLDEATKLAGSIFLDEARQGKAALHSLFLAGNAEAGRELVSRHGNGDGSLLSKAEAVALLISEVERGDPMAALDLYYYHSDFVGLAKLKPLMNLVKDRSAEIGEILSAYPPAGLRRTSPKPHGGASASPAGLVQDGRERPPRSGRRQAVLEEVIRRSSNPSRALGSAQVAPPGQ